MKRLLLAGCALILAACAADNPPAAPSPPAPAATTAAAQPPAPAQPVPPPAQTAAPAAITRTDYSNPDNWLCRPGKANDACLVDISTTIVKADGSTSVEAFKPDPNAPIDCFYVYPTVSLDPFMFSDLVPGPEELSVVKTQLARLGAKCRLFAPMYRQFSLGALRARTTGASVPARGSPAEANADVDGAWDWYLANENKGRGVVILGHSQGSGQIMRMIAQKVDGKPEQAKLVSAIVLGSSVQVPVGKDVGGTFKSIPVCRSADQTGCVISFSTFRDTVPPSATSNFGRGRDGMEAVCTNPAALAGGEAKAPKAYFSNGNREWVKGKTVATPFVATPGLITTECVRKNDHHYLEMRIKADPADPRIDDPGTDILADGKPDPAWGLHLIDANVAMGDLADVIERQGKAWKAANK